VPKKYRNKILIEMDTFDKEEVRLLQINFTNKTGKVFGFAQQEGILYLFFNE
jgi:hypothetical protein